MMTRVTNRDWSLKGPHEIAQGFALGQATNTQDEP